MKIRKIEVNNFRLLQNSSLDMTDGLTLLVGKNNTGKTSFVVLLEKFLKNSNPSFNYSDFPVSLREKLHNITEETNIDELTIRLSICVEYSDDDNLENISDFMLDLDPDRTTIHILFEAKIDKDALIARMPKPKEGVDEEQFQTEKRIFIERNIIKFINTTIYAYDDFGYEGDKPYYLENRDDLEVKEFKNVGKVLNIQVIHAKRNVASSDETGKSPLSSVTTQYFKKLDDSNDDRLVNIRNALIKIDQGLENQYSTVFSDFLSNSAGFLNLNGLKVVSDIEASALIGTSSKIIYGTTDDHLPENLNGLGYLNILYLLLKVEIAKKEFQASDTDINLLLIEEPEAHTHPQMQCIFSKKIRELVGEITALQAIVSTHSSYIVSNSEFKDIRYLAKSDKGNVEFKNFHTDLAAQYSKIESEDGSKLYQFLEQYLKIQNAELFFADKAIFIEGTTERMLLPLFIKEFDKNCQDGLKKIGQQNISVIEAGANAKAFAPFLDFIGIKSLIITDLDSTKKVIKKGKNDKESTVYETCPVDESTHTSNETLKYFLAAPSIKDEEKFTEWFGQLKQKKLVQRSKNIYVAYQLEENGYNARSFEDAFMNSNKLEIKKMSDRLLGLKNIKALQDVEMANIYELTDTVLAKKSDFAASLLYMALTDQVTWVTPKYINEGLKWISQ
ncbi:ATP-dependent nuclease [Shewanella japonica]|uniref:ATP-dependent nuclease n=1 Tax=Shewanella japonica TaxID=93973 RepID=UPI002494E97D|nr:ATP-dependent endonuclease [Shewanella japonica]